MDNEASPTNIVIVHWPLHAIQQSAHKGLDVLQQPGNAIADQTAVELQYDGN